MNRLLQVVICFCMLFAVTATANSQEEQTHKKGDRGKYVKIGAITMAVGATTAIIGGANAFDDGGYAAFTVGVGAFAIGTGVLIYGLTRRANSQSSFKDDFTPPALMFGVAPTKGGAAVGAVFRW